MPQARLRCILRLPESRQGSSSAAAHHPPLPGDEPHQRDRRLLAVGAGAAPGAGPRETNGPSGDQERRLRQTEAPEETGAGLQPGPPAGAEGVGGPVKRAGSPSRLLLPQRLHTDGELPGAADLLREPEPLWQQHKQDTAVSVLCKHDQLEIYRSKAEQYRQNMRVRPAEFPREAL